MSVMECKPLATLLSPFVEALFLALQVMILLSGKLSNTVESDGKVENCAVDVQIVKLESIYTPRCTKNILVTTLYESAGKC